VTSAVELNCPPLFGTRRSPDRPTLGPQVSRLAEALGKPPLPHQRLIYDVAFEIDPATGMLAYDEVNVIGPRQVTGKTELMLPAMTYRCVAFDEALTDWIRRELGKDVPLPGPQRVLYTAQTADNAREKWRDVHVKRLEQSPLRSQVKTRLRLNAEQIAFPNGSTWSPGSTTGKTAGTGDTLDMPVIDESWSREDNRTELGLRPAMLTRPWRQLWSLSMIPGISRALPGGWPYLWAKRQNGRARVEADIRSRVAHFEWAAAPGLDPADPATWFSCMPALGHHVPLSSVQSDYEAMVGAGNLSDFCAEYLGWPPEATAARWAVISEPTWRSLKLPQLDGIPYGDPVAFAVEAQPEQVSASIGMSARTAEGHTYVELVERGPGLNWTIDYLLDLIEKYCPCAVGIAAHGPAAPIIEPLRRAIRDDKRNLDTELIIMQGPDVAKACAQFYTETGEVGDHVEDTGRRIRHIGQPELDHSVADAVRYRFNDQWRFQRSGEAGDASPLYSVALARAAGEAVEWLGGSYDIGDSLG
jgi:hypothetical protein